MKALRHATQKKFHFTFEVTIIDLQLNVAKNVNLEGGSQDIGYKVEWSRGSKHKGSTEIALADLKGRVRFSKSSSTYSIAASLYRDDTDFEPKLMSFTAYMVTQSRVSGSKKNYKLGKGKINLALFEHAVPVRLFCKPATLDAVVNVFVSSLENKPSTSASFRMLPSSRSAAADDFSLGFGPIVGAGAKHRSRSVADLPVTTPTSAELLQQSYPRYGGGSMARSVSARSASSCASSSASGDSSEKEDEDDENDNNEDEDSVVLPGDSISTVGGGTAAAGGTAGGGGGNKLTTLKKSDTPDLKDVRLMLAKMDMIKASLDTLPVSYRVRTCRQLKELGWVKEKPECEITINDLTAAEKKLAELTQILPSHLREAIRKKQVQFKDPLLSSNNLKELQTIAAANHPRRPTVVISNNVTTCSSKSSQQQQQDRSETTQIPTWTTVKAGGGEGGSDDDDDNEANEGRNGRRKPPPSAKNGTRKNGEEDDDDEDEVEEEDYDHGHDDVPASRRKASLDRLRKVMAQLDVEDDGDEGENSHGGGTGDQQPPYRRRRKDDNSRKKGGAAQGDKSGALTIFDDRRACQGCEVM